MKFTCRLLPVRYEVGGGGLEEFKEVKSREMECLVSESSGLVVEENLITSTGRARSIDEKE